MFDNNETQNSEINLIFEQILLLLLLIEDDGHAFSKYWPSRSSYDTLTVQIGFQFNG